MAGHRLTYLLLLVTVLIVSSLASASELGSYTSLTYTSERYDPYVHYRLSQGDKPEWITTSLIIYNYSGVLYVIKAHNDTVMRFELAQKGDYISSHVTVLLNNVTVMTFLPRGTAPPVFWNESEVLSEKVEKSHNPDFKDWNWYVFKLGEVTIRGAYLIRKSDLQVVKDGKVYGHTMLFDDPGNPLEKGDSFSEYPFATSIDRVTIDNDKPRRWKNVTYYPPLKTVVTGQYSFNLTQPFGRGYPLMDVQMATLIYTFDASDGKLVFTPNGGPDLWAVGILDASFADEYALYQVEVKHDDSYAVGLVLKAFRLKEGKHETVAFEKRGTETSYVFYASLVVLVLTVVLTRRNVLRRTADRHSGR
ncbi:hypothetical protein CL1_1924 [Thermococcus cleftensis]|uniref:Uncharacterized protein n=1 Tax=Thermococcus cleftensis (strain DSM 27260 / KACC 17922 / CL1) TaxID=163003 RepID=I3ZWN5_THECF|nr:hypothetical protein CL1_1924 [Thermococcus cleftensis]